MHPPTALMTRPAALAAVLCAVLLTSSAAAHEADPLSHRAAPHPTLPKAVMVQEPMAVLPAEQHMGDVSETDMGFIEHAAVINRAQRAYAKLALRKATAVEVREAAQLLLIFHQRADAQLTSIAQPRGVSLPRGIDAEHQLLRARLMDSDSKEFDRLYLRTQLHEHETALRVFHMQESYGKNHALRVWARGMITNLEAHRRMLQDLSTPKPVS